MGIRPPERVGERREGYGRAVAATSYDIRIDGDDDTEFAGRLASGLAPGEEICLTCDADLEAPLDEPPSEDTTK